MENPDQQENFHLFRLFRSIAINFAGPFISIYAHTLGFSHSFIAFYSGLAEIAGDISRFIAGFLLNIFRDAKKFTEIIILLWSLIWILFPFAKNEYVFATIAVLESVLKSSFIVSYLVLLVDLLKGKGRIKSITKLNVFAAIGAIIGNFFSGLLLYVYGFTIYVFIITSIVSFISLIIFNKINFTRRGNELKREKIRLHLRKVFSDKKFTRFTLVASLFYFSVGISTSYFPIFLVENLKLTTFHWGIVNVVQTISLIILGNYIYRTIKWLGYRRSFLVSSMMISLNPFIWVYFARYDIILVWTFFTGITTSMYNIALTSYLSFIIRKNYTEEKSGVFYLLYGLSLSFGYFTGSIMAKFMALEQIMYISFIIRVIFSSVFVFIGKQEYRMSDFAVSLPKIIVKRTLLSFYVLSKMIRNFGNDLKNTEIKFS